MESKYPTYQFLNPQSTGNSPNTLLIKKNYLLSEWYDELYRSEASDKSMFKYRQYWPILAAFTIGWFPFYFVGIKAKNLPLGLMTTATLNFPFVVYYLKKRGEVQNQFMRMNYHLIPKEKRDIVNDFDDEKMEQFLPKNYQIEDLERKIKTYFDVD